MTLDEQRLIHLIKYSFQQPIRTESGEILVYLSLYDIEEFRDLVGNGFFDDGLEVIMFDGYICFDGTYLLSEYFEIDEYIFQEEEDYNDQR